MLRLDCKSSGHGHWKESHGGDGLFAISIARQDIRQPNKASVEALNNLVSLMSAQRLLSLAANHPLNSNMKSPQARPFLMHVYFKAA